jgi:endoglycosylceramidase
MATAALAALAAIAFAPAALAGPTAPLSHSGRWITDAKGRVAILHGVNMVNKQAPYAPSATGFGDDDAAFLQRNGFDAVRLGLIYKGVEPAPGVYDDAYLNAIAATEANLARHGVFSQLDFHQDMYNERYQGEGWPDWAVLDDGIPNEPQAGFPNNYFLNAALIRAFDSFWGNRAGPGGIGLQDRYAAAWAHVASRFATAKHTLGFDLLNEPWPGTPWITCLTLNGCPDFDTGTMGPFYRLLFDRIRAVEAQKLIWYEPNVLFNFSADTNIPALGDHAAGFSFHFYCTPGLAAPPYNLASCDQQNDHVLANADKRAQSTGDALMLSEFGATDDLATIRSNIKLADQHMVSWEYWHYCECLDPTTTGTGTQAIVIDPNQPPTGANVKQAKLDVLAEPYPQVVAGTPTSFGFDSATRAFSLAYSTNGPTGKNFSRRIGKRKKRSKAKFRQTQIFLPKDHYPGGYTASVRGGGIASKRKASLLRVIACPGRRNVSVTVKPKGTGGRNHTDCRVTGRGKKRGH